MIDELGRPLEQARRGPRRMSYWPSECLQLDVQKLKRFLKADRPITMVEFPGLRHSVDVSRTSSERLYLSRCPPPVETQEIELEIVPWGPERQFERYFLKCPYCDVRTTKLYIPWGQTGFGCRECKNVRYRQRRDLLDTLVVAHARLGDRLEQLIKRRARDKTHLAAPSNDEEVHARADELLKEFERVNRQLDRHTHELMS